MSLPIISIIGRPNVGKSSLFNALSNKKSAIVSNKSGVTRDRQFTRISINQSDIWLVDTAGLGDESDKLSSSMLRQSWAAAGQSDLVLFTVSDSLHPNDVTIIRKIQKQKTPIILLINKCDLTKHPEILLQEFASLGVKEVQLVSATQQTGLNDLKTMIADHMPESISIEESDTPTISLVGKPNAGKSTLLNYYAKEERCIVSPIPGTTRDSIKIEHEHQGKMYHLIDTAGMRRKARINEEIEHYATAHTLRAIESASTIIHMIDASENIARQDFRITHLCLDMGKSVIIAINKIDLLNQKERKLLQTDIKVALNHLPQIPIIELSAAQGRCTQKLIQLACSLCQSHNKDYPTSMLTRILERLVKNTAPPTRLGRPINLRMANQSRSNPLEITIHGKRTDYLPKSYVRYLQNGYIRQLNLKARIIKIKLKSDHNPYA
ncbi:ribosome biogenesis GTPase Der [Candidatus Comchoanobacter bicostacola]|uniref:GTPase Der n=1 Tax=Candidatus Comchoanobacter bicostacola TaxID=2919598 RepID=A0ABY5DK79_9GAMM|nr:ribosome biogenesis GTPase Der [Candidatus Comchoanobacter bicostacola]UTC24885.1 ribosome biogenesis GTPase Der [Candidatus Comchoanobacter bicostacola]